MTDFHSRWHNRVAAVVSTGFLAAMGAGASAEDAAPSEYRLRIDSPSHGSVLFAQQGEDWPLVRTIEGRVEGGDRNRALFVEVSVLTDTWYPQGVAVVGQDGRWSLSGYFGGTTHRLRARLTDAADTELAVSTVELAARRLPIELSLSGELGAASGPSWSAAWLDLASATDFEVGDLLRFEIGGSARRVVVRLLPKGGDPGTQIGVVGGVISVPYDRILEVVLKRRRRAVVQISVHGGSNAWSMALGAGNGSVTLDRVDLVRGRP